MLLFWARGTIIQGMPCSAGLAIMGGAKLSAGLTASSNAGANLSCRRSIHYFAGRSANRKAKKVYPPISGTAK